PAGIERVRPIAERCAMSLSSCPDRARWQALLDGSLAESQQAELSSHLDTCLDCRQTLEHLATGGKLLPETAGPSGPAPEAALRRAMAELKGTPSEAPTPLGQESSRDPVLAFLSPSEHPGYLGRLGPYDVIEVIGRGGMGVVLKAFDPSLQRIVAIK